MYNVDYKSSRLAVFFEWLCLMIVFTIIIILLSSIWVQPTTHQDIQVTLTSVSLKNPTIISDINYLAPPQEKLKTLDGLFLGHVAPDFLLPTLDGRQLSLSEYKGQAVLLNFWASWCVPCREEAPFLVGAYARYKDQGFTILGINLTEQDTLPEVEAFVDEFKIPYPIILDEPGHITNESYRLLGLPMSIFVSPNGTIKRIVIGSVRQTEIDQYVAEILEDK